MAPGRVLPSVKACWYPGERGALNLQVDVG